jgi:hypothetical protein
MVQDKVKRCGLVNTAINPSFALKGSDFLALYERLSAFKKDVCSAQFLSNTQRNCSTKQTFVIIV